MNCILVKAFLMSRLALALYQRMRRSAKWRGLSFLGGGGCVLVLRALCLMPVTKSRY